MSVSEISEREAIEKLFEGVVPERLTEVLALHDHYSPHYSLIGDSPGFRLAAGPFGAIQFTQRSLEQLWLFSHAGLQSLRCYSGVIIDAYLRQLPFSCKEIEKIPGQVEHSSRFCELIAHIESLRAVHSEHDFIWPQEIPRPDAGRPGHIEHAAFYELALIATAYAFLHELRHVMYWVDRDAPEDPIEEEHECDSYARSLILANAKEYAIDAGYPVDKVLTKRSMGLALASGFLFAVTPTNNLPGSSSHPAVSARWRRALQSVDLPDDDCHWLFFSSLALALISSRGIEIEEQTIKSFKSLAFKAVESIEMGI
jgi:hypothetical protein